MNGIIYKVENFLNKKIYIGKTFQDFSIRKSQHKYESKRRSSYFYTAIRKYGWDNFIWTILGECFSKEELNEAEITCIEFFQSNNKIYGYNLTKGGDGWEKGLPQSKASIEKRKGRSPWNKGLTKETDVRVLNNITKTGISLKRKYKTGEIKSWNKGLTKETDPRIKKFSNNLYGRKKSEECRKKISETKKSKKISSPFKGKHHSEEAKQKLRESRLNKKVTEETKEKISKTLKGRVPWNKGIKWKIKRHRQIINQ